MNEFLFAIYTSIAFTILIFIFDIIKFLIIYFYIKFDIKRDSRAGGVNWKDNKAVLVLRNWRPWHLKVRNIQIKHSSSDRFYPCKYSGNASNYYFEPYYDITGGFVSLPPYTLDRWDCPTLKNEDSIVESYIECEFNFWLFSFLKKIYFSKKKIESLNKSHRASHRNNPKISLPEKDNENK